VRFRRMVLAGAAVFLLSGCKPGPPHAPERPQVQRILSDNRYEWVTVETTNTRIHFPRGTFAEANQTAIRERAEESRNTVLRRLAKPDYSEILDLFYVDSREDMAVLTGTPVTGYAYFDDSAVVLVFNETWRAFERHELTHVVTLGTWPEPAGMAVVEGLATYVDGECGGYPNGRVIRAIQEKEGLIPLETLAGDFRGQRDLTAYLQAAATIEFMVRKEDPEVIRLLWDQGLQFAPSLLEISTGDFERDFREWLSSAFEPIPAKAWEAISGGGCGVSANPLAAPLHSQAPVKPLKTQELGDWAYLGQHVPGLASEKFAPEIISTQDGELNSIFSSDLKEFYFTRRGIPVIPPAIMVTQLGSEGWSVPENLGFDERYSAIDLFLIADGERMVFCSNRPHEGDDGPRGDHDLWVSKREGDGWGDPRIFAPEALSDAEDFYPVLTENGNLYFNSQRVGPGTNNIFRSKWNGREYLPAEILPAPINSEHREFDAYVSPGEDMILFSSDRPGGFGRADLYVSFLQDGRWSAPRNVGGDVNSEASEYGAMISPDGKFLFFTSSKDGTEDIYWVSADVLGAGEPGVIESPEV